ncbi:MAG: dihydrodipicolinate synthase family protein [Moraxellaceae bacterium]|nr:MAG: dihydrodipicolinate synthase family protein [Moraxellaceae bacterium]
MIAKKFKGVVVPMVSPFTKTHIIDVGAVKKITEYLVEHGTQPFVLGTTGESASIAKNERLTLVKETVLAAKGSATVYAGISGNCFAEVLDEAKAFADLGVDALVSTMPSYYPVDDSQMLNYFELLANSVPLPLIIYNIPATTHLSIPLNMVAKLSEHKNIYGFKDSEKGAERVREAIDRFKNREDFSYLLGWALMSQEAMLLGADGIVPSTGNISPGLYQRIYEAGRAGKSQEALAAQNKADDISNLYQKDKILSRSLPALKAMMSAYHLCTPAVLPPFAELGEDESKAIITQLLNTYGDVADINNITNNEQ